MYLIGHHSFFPVVGNLKRCSSHGVGLIVPAVFGCCIFACAHDRGTGHEDSSEGISGGQPASEVGVRGSEVGAW